MKRIQYDHYGDDEEMSLADFEPAPLGADEVLVAVKAASINPFDWKIRQGKFKLFTGSRFPRGIGSDFSGVITGVGPDVSDFHVGDEVVGTVPPKTAGAFAEAVVVQAKFVAKKPAGLSFVEAAALPGVGVTAWLALVKTANLQSGQRVFINGAMGGVGQAALSLAKHIGAAVAGRVSPADLVEGPALGLNPVLDYTKSVPTSLNQTFDVVLDFNGSLSPRESHALAKPTGLVIDINPTGGKMIKALLSRKQKIVIFNGAKSNVQAVMDLGIAGAIRVPVTQSVALKDAIPLITALEKGQRTSGKSVILFD